MNDNWIYLISSNATKEYLMDILEILALPYGAVQHFRYRLRWLDPELKMELPLKDKQNNKLKNRKVAICYLYQKKEDGKWEWINIYPIRLGKIFDAYKTGDNDNDIAHFYFGVENYALYNDQNFTEIIKNLANKKWGSSYAFLGNAFDGQSIADKRNSRSAFYKICNSLKAEHIRSPEGRGYSPVYCFIDGLRDNYGKILTPKYNCVTRKSYFEITEGNHYSFEFSTYFPEQQQPPLCSVKLITEEKVFSSPPINELIISSHYDEESYSIISKLLERDTFTSIIFATEFLEKNEAKESLNIKITFPIKVKRKIIYRFIDYGSDLGFAVGTGTIALAKIIEKKWLWWDQNWIWFVIGGYILFAICKGIIKLWRG